MKFSMAMLLMGLTLNTFAVTPSFTINDEGIEVISQRAQASQEKCQSMKEQLTNERSTQRLKDDITLGVAQGQLSGAGREVIFKTIDRMVKMGDELCAQVDVFAKDVEDIKTNGAREGSAFILDDHVEAIKGIATTALGEIVVIIEEGSANVGENDQLIIDELGGMIKMLAQKIAASQTR